KMSVLIASHNFLADTTLFQLTLSFHNPDKFEFIDFARRQKIKF
ncbi:MAG: trehalose operon repressor, partial [Lactobacillus sp.]|nr:trehalose operon repressor [Lactobacillus sp.]